jgi:hypothetical protein
LLQETDMNTNPPIPEPREVLGLTASFSGIAAMLVLATLAPHPQPHAPAGQSIAAQPANEGDVRAMGV